MSGETRVAHGWHATAGIFYITHRVKSRQHAPPSPCVLCCCRGGGWMVGGLVGVGWTTVGGGRTLDVAMLRHRQVGMFFPIEAPSYPSWSTFTTPEEGKSIVYATLCRSLISAPRVENVQQG